MYQALYRKYRPRTFDEVVGQKHITDVLAYAVQNQKTSHAYLFCGSRGTGKTTCAKILARAVNCLSPVDGSPCGVCEACRATESGNATDIVEMDAASNNGVNDVRDIRDAVVYAPSLLKYRVFIIDEVHMLSVSAFNALLKTLEEPPSHVVFILATTELQKLPATIVSRCQRFDFRRITSGDIASHLTRIAENEDLRLDADAAMALARLARGGMRDAISLLELNVRPDRHITLQSVSEVTGMIGRGEIARLVDHIAHNRGEDIFGFIDELYTSSKDISVFWQDLVSFYRDMLVVKTAADPQRYLDVTADELRDLQVCASYFSYPNLLWQAKLLSDAGIRMQRGGDRRIDAELTLIRLTNPDCDTSLEALTARLRALEDRIAMGGVAQTVHADLSPQIQNSGEPCAPQPTSAPDNAEWKAVGWFREVARRLEDSDPGKASFLRDAKAFFCPQTGRVRLFLPNALALRMLNNKDTCTLLVNLMQEYEKVSGLDLVGPDTNKDDSSFQFIDEIIQGKDSEPQ